MADTGFRGPRQVWAAFLWSVQGLRAAWRHEASFRLDACLSIVAIPVGLWLGHGGVEKLLLTAPLLLLLAVELVNSAIEAIVDRVSPEYSELAGRAKDMGSAAVFMMLLLAGLAWALILVPRVL
ncbi:MAG TPA: diacylglycerol kinase [Rhodanobacteraceae bacterium]|nr:diacylglycerol kinase [Rhodanobacteraceae bacterium]